MRLLIAELNATLEEIGIIVTGILFVVFLVIIIAFTLSALLPSRYSKKIINQTNSVRVFTLDFLKDEIIFFNRSNLRKHRRENIHSFYMQFPEYEREKIRLWFENLLSEEKNTANFLEVDVTVSRERKRFFSILHAQNINRKRQRIHLESYLLKYVSPTAPDAKSKYILENQQALENIILKQKDARRGATFIVRFYPMKNLTNSTGSEVEAIILAQLKNKVFPFANSSRLLVQHSNYDIILYDTKIATRGNCLQLAASLNKELEKYLQINGLESNYDFIIGVVENKYFDSINDLIQQAKNIAIAGETRGEHIVIYNRDVQFSDAENIAFSEELKKIIAQKAISSTYQPLFNMETNKVFGFTHLARPEFPLLNTIEELIEYASRVDQEKEVCSLIIREAVSDFIEERDNKGQILLLDVFALDKNSYIDLVEEIVADLDIEIGYVYSESILLATPVNEQDEFIATLKTCQEKERTNILRLKDKNIMLNRKIVNCFDYLLIDEHMTKNIGKAAKSRLHIHALLERTIQFHKPFIAINLDSWSGIEIVVKSGINIISSDVIAPYSEKIKPINKKILGKLKSLKGESDIF